MSIIDYIRGEYVKGKVVDKYSLNNGNIGMVVDDIGTKKRYHVEFKDGYKGPAIDNLFGFLKDPFAEKTDPIDKLIKKGDFVELTLNYSKGPFRQAYKIHSVSGIPYKNKAADFPYKYFRLSQYKS
jgi:hypothetical protein